MACTGCGSNSVPEQKKVSPIMTTQAQPSREDIVRLHEIRLQQQGLSSIAITPNTSRRR